MVDNQFNQKQYEAHAGSYIESNRDGGIGGKSPEERVSILKSFLPKGRSVFEIGSASGDEAIVLQQAGYQVTASDFVEAFVSNLSEKGLTACLFDAKKDDFPEIDALYANAVFVHFSPDEFKNCLERVHEKLQNEKIVSFSVIRGEGSERSGRARGIERDFHYYTMDSLQQLLKESGYKILFSDDTDKKWIQVVCQAV